MPGPRTTSSSVHVLCVLCIVYTVWIGLGEVSGQVYCTHGFPWDICGIDQSDCEKRGIYFSWSPRYRDL